MLTWINNIRFPGTREIIITKGWCIPARGPVLTALNPYGVDVVDVSEEIISDWSGNALYIEARIRVREPQAAWAEYLLLRSGKFILISAPINRRNREWARRHNGVMPTPWSLNAQPWIESGCTKSTKQPAQKGKKK